MMTGEDRFDVDAVVETFDLMPAEFVRSGFKLMNPLGDAALAANLAANAPTPVAGRAQGDEPLGQRMDAPAQAVLPPVGAPLLPGQRARPREFRVLGEKINLGRITVPLFCVGAAKDDIVRLPAPVPSWTPSGAKTRRSRS
jgi:hypothetical protein